MDRLGFGCATIGGLHGPVPAADAEAALAVAWAGGVRYFDVAPLYGAGEGEERLGRFFEGRPRQSYRVSSKVGWRAVEGRCIPDYSRDGVRRTIDESLSRLGVERLDAVFIHDIDASNHGADQPRVFAEAMSGALPALLDLRRAGIVDAIGVGVNDPVVCLAALEHDAFDAFLIAGRYTLLDQLALDTLLPACLARGVRVIVGAPFNTGILAGGMRFGHAAAPSDIVDRARRIAEICHEFDIPLGAAALQFPIRHPAVSCVLPGPRNASQAGVCAEWMRVAIPSAFWDFLQERGFIPQDVPGAERVPA